MTQPPRLAISACLLGERVRYDGDHKRAPWLEAMGDVVWVPVCPEVELGLGVPRPPIRVEVGDAGAALRVLATGEDLGARMDALAASRLQDLADAGVVGFVLKARSPSCALDDAVWWRGTVRASTHGAGRFAEAVLRDGRFLAVSDETLLDPDAREAFLRQVRDREHARARGHGTPPS